MVKERGDGKTWRLPKEIGTFTFTDDRIELTYRDGMRRILSFSRAGDAIVIDGVQFIRKR